VGGSTYRRQNLGTLLRVGKRAIITFIITIVSLSDTMATYDERGQNCK